MLDSVSPQGAPHQARYLAASHMIRNTCNLLRSITCELQEASAVCKEGQAEKAEKACLPLVSLGQASSKPLRSLKIQTMHIQEVHMQNVILNFHLSLHNGAQPQKRSGAWAPCECQHLAEQHE